MFCHHDPQPQQTYPNECRLIVCTKCGKRWLEVSRNPEARPELLPWTEERERFYQSLPASTSTSSTITTSPSPPDGP